MEPPALPAFVSRTGDDCFDLYFAIPPVVVIYGRGNSMNADEFNHAGRLLRQLDQLGRSGERVNGMVCQLGALDRSSIRALNCFLRYGPGLASVNRAAGYHSTRAYFHKYDWQEFCRMVGLRWVR